MIVLATLGWGVAAALYLLAASLTRWPRWRSASFVAGTAVAALAPLTISGDSPTLAAHMLEHALLICAAAPLLALGAPYVLALRTTRGPVRRGLVEMIRSPVGSAAGDPRVVWVVFIVVVWAAHVPSLIAAIDTSPVLHGLEHLVLVALAFAFWTCALGTAPIPRPLGRGARSAYVLVAAPALDLAAVGLMATGHAEAGVAMIAGMLPLAAAGVWLTWRWVEAEERGVRATTGEVAGAPR